MGRQTLSLFPQLKAYQSSPTQPAGWRRCQGYTKLIVLSGSGPKGDTPTPDKL